LGRNSGWKPKATKKQQALAAGIVLAVMVPGGVALTVGFVYLMGVRETYGTEGSVFIAVLVVFGLVTFAVVVKLLSKDWNVKLFGSESSDWFTHP